MLVVDCWLLVVGCWLLVVGCWLLVIGYWFLVFGFCILVVDVDTGYINAAGISSHKAPQLVCGFQECYEELKSKGIIA